MHILYILEYSVDFAVSIYLSIPRISNIISIIKECLFSRLLKGKNNAECKMIIPIKTSIQSYIYYYSNNEK